MFKTVGNALLGVGALVSLTGLLFLPAAVNGRRAGDEGLMGAGLTIFATGALVAAGGFYAKARSLTARAMSEANGLRTLEEKRRGSCELCQHGPPVITCTIHRRNLCASCLVEHYEPIACVYTPALSSMGKKRQGQALRASANL